MDGGAAKRSGVASRRFVQQGGLSAEESRPLVAASADSKTTAPPVSGNFLSYFQTDKSSAKKRRYQVNIPWKLVLLLALIFIVGPLMIFGYKEVHIHDDQGHDSTMRVPSLSTQDVFAHFLAGSVSSSSASTNKTTLDESSDGPITEQPPEPAVEVQSSASSDVSEQETPLEKDMAEQTITMTSNNNNNSTQDLSKSLSHSMPSEDASHQRQRRRNLRLLR